MGKKVETCIKIEKIYTILKGKQFDVMLFIYIFAKEYK
jgi:hypothetical protein